MKMEFERRYHEFGGRRGAPPGNEKCPMWSAGWARGSLMVMEECGMKFRGANPGKRAPTRIEERKSMPRTADGDCGELIQQSSPSMLSSAERGVR